MEAPLPSVDHSIWRYYQDGGKGFAARRAERMGKAPRKAHIAEKETLARAAGKVKRERTSGSTASRRGQGRPNLDAAVERARQALLGMILQEGVSGEDVRIPVDAKIFKEQIEAMPPETLQKMSAFFSTVRGGGKSASAENPVLQSLETELSKRGISLQLSGKVNNVYLSGEHASWAVNASAGAESESDKKEKSDKGGARYQKYNNFGQTLGRLAKNFLNGH